MNLHVVIAKYKESVDWTARLNKPFTVFNKNRDEDCLFANNLPNKGRETDTYLGFIINNYENLPDYVAFVQGNPFDHCSDAIDHINNFSFNEPCRSLGPIYLRNDNLMQPTIDWANTCNVQYAVKNGHPYIPFIGGMQCIVSKHLILNRSKDSYQHLYNNVSQELDYNSPTGYYYEYLWPTILNFNDLLLL